MESVGELAPRTRVVVAASDFEALYGRNHNVAVGPRAELRKDVHGTVVGHNHEHRGYCRVPLVPDCTVEPRAASTAAVGRRDSVEDHAERVTPAVRSNQQGAVDPAEGGHLVVSDEAGFNGDRLAPSREASAAGSALTTTVVPCPS